MNFAVHFSSYSVRLSVIERLLSLLKCLYPNPKSFEYIALHDTQDFAVLMLKLSRWRDYPRHLDGPSIIMSLYGGDRRVRVTGDVTTEAAVGVIK